MVWDFSSDFWCALFEANDDGTAITIYGKLDGKREMVAEIQPPSFGYEMFGDGEWTDINVHVKDRRLYKSAVRLAERYQRETKKAAKVVKMY
jgi:hypothetical protein